MDFAISGDHRVKIKETEKRDKYLNQRIKKHEGDVLEIWNQRMDRDYPDYSIVKIT